MKTIKIGSCVFFKNMPNYISKDVDEMAIQDKWLPKGINVLNFKKDKKDVFLWSPLTKEQFIEDTLNCKVPMRVGKFIVPEFCEYIGFEIKDYELLKPIFDKLDDKHKYEKVIMESYIENNSFTLTEDQLNKAYEVYKQARK